MMDLEDQTQKCYSCSVEAATHCDGTVPLCETCHSLVNSRQSSHHFRIGVLSETDPKVLLLQVARYLRSIPNLSISRLMTSFLEVLNSGMISIIERPVKAAVFTVTSLPQAYVVLPSNLAELLQSDMTTQLGTLVFIGSQAIDYVQERFLTETNSSDTRAKSYEAEFLMCARGNAAFWEPNSYQLDLLQKFPEGVSSQEALKVLYCPVLCSEVA